MAPFALWPHSNRVTYWERYSCPRPGRGAGSSAGPSPVLPACATRKPQMPSGTRAMRKAGRDAQERHPSNLIQAELTTLFAEKLGIEVPSSEADLVANGLLDSLAIVDLLVLLEQRYDIRIFLEDLELDNFRSVYQIAQFLAARNGSNGHTEA